MTNRLLYLPLFVGMALTAQTGKSAKPAEAPAEKVAEAPVSEPPAQDVAVIKITPYKPTIQRDPFATPRDDRPADALDLIDDISVKGMIRKDGKNFAIVSDSRGNVRWLPAGHRFKDGEISSITDKAVTFRQWDVNTTNRSVFRTITKTFKREEGKR
ncbi:pilus assembly protein PilP [Geothrix campi]|jgi:hypothetical protein|uniref:pilus assembly protein PilP n=1 Tax=Geothrix campi TaxID=2966450 RepID=UPI002147E4E0|nr:pilus assembly protein PilP [Geothrix sp. SG10]